MNTAQDEDESLHKKHRLKDIRRKNASRIDERRNHVFLLPSLGDKYGTLTLSQRKPKMPLAIMKEVKAMVRIIPACLLEISMTFT